MNTYYTEIYSFIKAGSGVKENSCILFKEYGKENIKDHVERVSNMAVLLSHRYGVDYDEIRVAAYLHDISGVIKKEKYIEIALLENIPILDEEKRYPMLLHQKISKDMAGKIFKIENKRILNAIECHTTLKRKSSIFDKILFISDKLEWDQEDRPKYFEEVEKKIKVSIDLGIECYLEYRMKNKHEMLVVHPWLKEAYFESIEERKRRTIASSL